MPSLDADSQCRFLLTCIKHCSNPGKVDFVAVANELGIVSKGAAAKRYERLLRSHNANANSKGDSPTPGGGDGDSEPATPKPKKKAAPRRSKKRKAETDDEQETKPLVKKERTMKTDEADDNIANEPLAGEV